MKVCVPKETEDLNISDFNMITGVNESERLTKYKSCKCKCKFKRRKYNSIENCNNDKCGRHVCEKSYIWNSGMCSCENGKYVVSITDKLSNYV